MARMKRVMKPVSLRKKRMMMKMCECFFIGTGLWSIQIVVTKIISIVIE